jgi:hypothetical protein
MEQRRVYQRLAKASSIAIIPDSPLFRLPARLMIGLCPDRTAEASGCATPLRGRACARPPGRRC